MNDHRQLLTMALDAIRIFREWEMGQDYHSNRDTVLARAFAAEEALEAALAEPETNPEPVEWIIDWAGRCRPLYAASPRLTPTQSTHSADCYKWHHECAIARIEETEELREALKAALEEVNHDGSIPQEQACSHCSHPLYAGIRCSQCGRWTGDDK